MHPPLTSAQVKQITAPPQKLHPIPSECPALTGRTHHHAYPSHMRMFHSPRVPTCCLLLLPAATHARPRLTANFAPRTPKKSTPHRKHFTPLPVSALHARDPPNTRPPTHARTETAGEGISFYWYNDNMHACAAQPTMHHSRARRSNESPPHRKHLAPEPVSALQARDPPTNRPHTLVRTETAASMNSHHMHAHADAPITSAHVKRIAAPPKTLHPTPSGSPARTGPTHHPAHPHSPAHPLPLGHRRTCMPLLLPNADPPTPGPNCAPGKQHQSPPTIINVDIDAKS